MLSFLKKIFQPLIDTAIAAGKPSAEAEAHSLIAHLETAIRNSVAKHVTDATAVALIMAETDAELAAVEAEGDAKIEAFRVKL